jgi:hypothetical protein
MPKDEFDFDDPMKLNGVALFTEEDTTDAMMECFVEEFMHLGYNPRQLLALFRNKHYVGMNMVLQNRGEPFVKDYIRDTYARWGRPFDWPAVPVSAPPAVATAGFSEQQIELDSTACDPMGAPVPKLQP